MEKLTVTPAPLLVPVFLTIRPANVRSELIESAPRQMGWNWTRAVSRCTFWLIKLPTGINMKTLTGLCALLLCATLLSACTTPKKDKDLDTTLAGYEKVVRWAEWDAAYAFLAPEYLAENPVTRLDMDRLRLFRVSNYTIRSATPINDGDGLLQTVEIRLFNRTQATERVVMDQQEWRYNPENERWMLHTGLPDVTQRY